MSSTRITSPRRPAPGRRGGRSAAGWRGALPFVLPTLVLFVGFLVYPMASTVVMSFFSWDGFITSPKTFVGFDNYVRIFTQDRCSGRRSATP